MSQLNHYDVNTSSFFPGPKVYHKPSVPLFINCHNDCLDYIVSSTDEKKKKKVRCVKKKKNMPKMSYSWLKNFSFPLKRGAKSGTSRNTFASESRMALARVQFTNQLCWQWRIFSSPFWLWQIEEPTSHHPYFFFYFVGIFWFPNEYGPFPK